MCICSDNKPDHSIIFSILVHIAFLNCCQYLRYMIYLKHMQCLAIRYDIFEFFGNNIAVFISTYINCLMEHIFRFYLPSDGFPMLFNVYVGLLVESMRIEIGLVLRS